jgi:hypothetical protein
MPRDLHNLSRWQLADVKLHILVWEVSDPPSSDRCPGRDSPFQETKPYNVANGVADVDLRTLDVLLALIVLPGLVEPVIHLELEIHTISEVSWTCWSLGEGCAFLRIALALIPLLVLRRECSHRVQAHETSSKSKLRKHEINGNGFDIIQRPVKFEDPKTKWFEKGACFQLVTF